METSPRAAVAATDDWARPLAARALGVCLAVGSLVAFARVAVGQVEPDDAGADATPPDANDASDASDETYDAEDGEAAADAEATIDLEASAADATLAVDAAASGSDATIPPPPSEAPPRAKSSIHYGASMDVAVYDDTDHVAVLTPTIAGHVEDPIAGWSVKGRYLVDVVSAASADIVSTASSRWHEVRHAGTLGADYAPGDFGVGATAAVSTEPDYLSWTFGGHASYELNQKNETAILGYAHGIDTIGRSGTPFDVFSRTLDRNAFDAGMTFVVDRATIVALTADAIYERGDPSKPYRYIPMFAPGVGATVRPGASVDEVNAARLPEKPLEQLPLARDRYALTARWLHRFEGSTGRVSERAYADSWGLKALTFDGDWLRDLGARGTSNIGPHLRAHAQLPVVFWQRTYEVQFTPGGEWNFPALRTGDRELGGLTTLTLGGTGHFDLGALFDVGAWALNAEVEGMWTHFYDALYVTNRLALLVSVGVEAQL